MTIKNIKYKHVQSAIQDISTPKPPQNAVDMQKSHLNQYKANWRRKRRQEQKEYTISFTPKELSPVVKAAKAHNRSPTRFIKDAVIAYSNSTVLIPDPTALASIREKLSLSYTALQQLSDDGVIKSSIGDQALRIIETLEKNILHIIHTIKLIPIS